jgi:hypothetical protein
MDGINLPSIAHKRMIISSITIFIVCLIIGFKIHQQRMAVISDLTLDPKEVLEMAIAIRKAKNRIYNEILNDIPPCLQCGPNVRHTNFSVD